jgi:hypothetical protein
MLQRSPQIALMLTDTEDCDLQELAGILEGISKLLRNWLSSIAAVLKMF